MMIAMMISMMIAMMIVMMIAMMIATSESDADFDDWQTWEVVSQLSVERSIRFAVVDLLTCGLLT